MLNYRAIPFTLLFLSIAYFLIITACNNSTKIQSIESALHFYKNKQPINSGELSIQYFGIGSTLITYNGKSVFTDPCFSTPSLKEVAFGNIVTDTSLIEFLNPSLQDVELTLIGHAHYDHMMDLPYLSSRFLPKESKIVGCQSALNLVSSAKIPQQFVVANKIKGNYNETGTWIYNQDSTVRTMVFEGHHPPQIAGIIKFGIGKVKKSLPAIPTKASKWKEGETYTFLIDFLDEEKQRVEKRVFVQTSSGRFPRGMVPQKILDKKGIDIVIIPADLNRTFEAIHYLKAEHYVVVHWENFFKSKLLKAVPFSKRSMNKIIHKIEELGLEEKVTVPLPGEFLIY